MSKIKLKPCPFCGSKPVMNVERFSHPPKYIQCIIVCPSCHVQLLRSGDEMIVANAWNKRTDNDQTNFDRIRGMTPQELVALLDKFAGGCQTCPAHDFCHNDKSETCVESMMGWLESEC